MNYQFIILIRLEYRSNENERKPMSTMLCFLREEHVRRTSGVLRGENQLNQGRVGLSLTNQKKYKEKNLKNLLKIKIW